MTTNRHDGASTAASPCSGNTAWETHQLISTFWVIRLSTLTPPSQSCLLLFVKSINVTFVTYSVYCFAGSPGLIIRTRTWIYRFQSSAYMVTMMTQLGWVSSMRKRCLLRGQRCKQACIHFLPGWRFMCFGFAECFWTCESLWSLPFSGEDRD